MDENAVNTDLRKELPNILVVDDDFVTLLLVRKTFSNQCSVDTASNGPEAVEKARQNNYDLIFMDISLVGDMDGVMALLEIRKIDNYKTVPVIAVTGHVVSGNKREFQDAGFDGYIVKPYDLSELRDTIDKYFKK